MFIDNTQQNYQDGLGSLGKIKLRKLFKKVGHVLKRTVQTASGYNLIKSQTAPRAERAKYRKRAKKGIKNLWKSNEEFTEGMIFKLQEH
jgi:hypothetical protein